LLSSGELFLSDPAVDASDLRLKVGLDVSDRLIFALELLSDVRVHLLIPISQLIRHLFAFHFVHPFPHLQLVPHVVHLSLSRIVLGEETVDEISHLDLKLVLEVVLEGTDHSTEIVVVLEALDLYPSHVILFFVLLDGHELEVLF